VSPPALQKRNINVLFQSQRGEKGGGKEREIPSPPDMPIRAINPSFAGPWLALLAHQVAGQQRRRAVGAM